MPITDFDGKCFVAYIDISGFKQMMKEKTAKDTMKKFYSVGYQTLFENGDIQGIFISDCGILFSGYENMPNKQQQLPSILKVVKDINIKMLNHDVMLTTSIAYGEFSIKKNLEFEGIVKTPVYGDAYVSAYLDNGKMKPGQCRIIRENIEWDEISSDVQSFMKKTKRPYYYYYWNVKYPCQVGKFRKEYQAIYHSQFETMRTTLKKYLDPPPQLPCQTMQGDNFV